MKSRLWAKPGNFVPGRERSKTPNGWPMQTAASHLKIHISRDSSGVGGFDARRRCARAGNGNDRTQIPPVSELRSRLRGKNREGIDKSDASQAENRIGTRSWIDLLSVPGVVTRPFAYQGSVPATCFLRKAKRVISGMPACIRRSGDFWIFDLARTSASILASKKRWLQVGGFPRLPPE